MFEKVKILLGTAAVVGIAALFMAQMPTSIPASVSPTKTLCQQGANILIEQVVNSKPGAVYRAAAMDPGIGEAVVNLGLFNSKEVATEGTIGNATVCSMTIWTDHNKIQSLIDQGIFKKEAAPMLATFFPDLRAQYKVQYLDDGRIYAQFG